MSSQPKHLNPAAAKRPFVKPTLRVYGTVRELTATVNQAGPPDGTGQTKNNMTRPH